MISKITEIDGIIDRLETLIKTLREERDSALNELVRVKKDLESRELEIMQMDEEIQKEAKRFEEERQFIMQERIEAGQRLDKMALRIKELAPPLSESINSENPAALERKQTELNYDED
jgi:uncharacterized FlgJ-related protein